MLNQYPLWKYIALIVAIIFGTLYALPNLYGEDPAVQVSHRTQSLDQESLLVIEQALNGGCLEAREESRDG